MKILLVTPHSLESPRGNTRTATRWGDLLSEMKHEVTVAEGYREGDTGEYDLLIALHAHKSGASVRRFRKRTSTPIIVALTGTDIYPDIYRKASAARTLDAADRLIVLQPLALSRLRPEHREKTRVVHQCAALNLPDPTGAAARESFTVHVVGNLRPVKDPFRAAMAARLLPPTSRIRVLHFGEALSATMAERARAEEKRNRRYEWRGLVPAQDLRVLMQRGDLWSSPRSTRAARTSSPRRSRAICRSSPRRWTATSGSSGRSTPATSRWETRGPSRRSWTAPSASRSSGPA